ncbi:MAG: glycine cleavage system protein H [Desulfamplus sp.]|nr:glycine cleavage system protein H [Desulfamplus sp.]
MRPGREGNRAKRSEINPSVFGNQVWTVKSSKSDRSKSEIEDQQTKPCIWMASGAVEKKHCNNYFNCNSCKYDAAMEKQVADGKQISWQNSMRKKESMDRTCRHSLTMRMVPRVCAYNYNCSTCDFDQYFEDVLSSATGHAAVAMHNVKGFNVPQGYYFHNGHTWAVIENGGYIKVGLDDFALKLLGEADALDLPMTGMELNRNRPGWGLRRKDNMADVLAPVNGVILQVNEKVRRDPRLANSDPYGDGWLFSVHNSDIKGAFKALMDHNESITWTGEEVTRLEEMIEAVAGPMSTDGGILRPDIYGNLPGLDWNQLTRVFLKNN